LSRRPPFVLSAVLTLSAELVAAAHFPCGEPFPSLQSVFLVVGDELRLIAADRRLPIHVRLGDGDRILRPGRSVPPGGALGLARTHSVVPHRKCDVGRDAQSPPHCQLDDGDSRRPRSLSLGDRNTRRSQKRFSPEHHARVRGVRRGGSDARVAVFQHRRELHSRQRAGERAVWLRAVWFHDGPLRPRRHRSPLLPTLALARISRRWLSGNTHGVCAFSLRESSVWRSLRLLSGILRAGGSRRDCILWNPPSFRPNLPPPS